MTDIEELETAIDYLTYQCNAITEGGTAYLSQGGIHVKDRENEFRFPIIRGENEMEGALELTVRLFGAIDALVAVLQAELDWIRDGKTPLGSYIEGAIPSPSVIVLARAINGAAS